MLGSKSKRSQVSLALEYYHCQKNDLHWFVQGCVEDTAKYYAELAGGIADQGNGCCLPFCAASGTAFRMYCGP